MLSEVWATFKDTQPVLFDQMSSMPVKLRNSTKVSEHFSTTHWNCFQIEYRHEGKSLLVTLRTLMKTLVAAYKEKDGGLHSELLATNKSHLTPQLPPLHKI